MACSRQSFSTPPPVDLIVDILPMVHHVLIMSVNPASAAGIHPLFSGQNPPPRRIRRELGLAFKIEVDGGVAHDTVAK